MALCGSCGQDNPAGFRFCGACGAALAAAAALRQEERKVVTVLFCDLVGSTARGDQADPEDLRAVMDPYHALLAREIEGFGGTVEKFIGDAVMALFGAPVAHEDDPERAVRAALSIRDAIAEGNERHPGRDLHVRLAVTTGEVLVALGPNLAEDLGRASGDVINTCARLQSAAPVDGVLVGEVTYRATARAIDYRAVDPVSVKGKADPILVWQALEPRASLGVELESGTRTPLVGRSAELDVLRGALRRACTEDTPQLVTLVGVPGIGKSRLVYELRRLVEAEPELITWRQGRSLPYGEGRTFRALAEIVGAQAGILESDDAATAGAKLRRAITDLVTDAATAAWLERHARPLLGLPADDPDAAPGTADRQSEAFAAWRRLLEALAERRPLVLVFEDLHWADEMLLDFLTHLLEWCDEVPLLVVATTRPELQARRAHWGGGTTNAAMVSLAPLSSEDTVRLLAAVLDQAIVPPGLQTALVARAGGNPLYAEEFVAMLVDRGYLRRVGGDWQLDHADELPLPESIQAIIAARLDALAPQEKALLQNAAVVGKVVWPGALAAIGGAAREALDGSLHTLERRELLQRERRSAVAGEQQYRFRHVLVQEVCYGQIPRARRAEKHRRAAEWLTSLAPDRAEHRVELVAFHYTSALRYARASGEDTQELEALALAALKVAGEAAFAVNAFGAAIAFFDQALSLCPADDPHRPRLQLALGTARYWNDHGGASLLLEARDGLLALGDVEAAAEAESTLGLCLRDTDRHAAMEHLRGAVALLSEAPATRAKALTLTALGGALMMASHPDTLPVCREALAVAEQLGLLEIAMRSQNFLGLARLDQGDLGGFEDLQQSAAVARTTNFGYNPIVISNLGDALVEMGRLEAGIEAQAEAEASGERLGASIFITGWFRANQATNAYWTGQWSRATALIDDLVASAVEVGVPYYFEPRYRVIRGHLRLAVGDRTGAQEDAATALRAARSTEDPQLLYPALAFQARVRMALDDHPGATSSVDELLEIVRRSRDLPTASLWAADLSPVAAQLGRGSALLALLRGGWAASEWITAAAAVARGDDQFAAECYGAIGSRPDEAFARLRAAAHLAAAGRRAAADAELDRAAAFYREVGATGYVRECEAMLTPSA